MMIPLSKGRHALIDAEDFELVRAYRWHITSDHGSRQGYARSQDADGKPVHMHRLLTDAPKGKVVDHINGDTLDNRRVNLRVCSSKDNHRNRRMRVDSLTGFKGVTKNKGSKTFKASIMANGKRIACGSYETDIEAAAAYDRAAVQHFGEYAQLNFDPARDWLLPYASCAK